ncbi:MAG: 3'-5' exonuclease [Nannocystales bacterium]
MEEELRLAYVALTRAKRHLILSIAARRHIFGQTQVGTPLALPRRPSSRAHAPRRGRAVLRRLRAMLCPSPAAESW